ncbi:MAG: aldose epimerase family protein [Hungatella hathewayi]|uniref:aldose epimerase family protein n=1 Tax=Hungatella TaxID=1649459 RepID=UPI0011DD32AE|nr:aldose epimerase family protein [Hungatella hathewayi]MDU4974938.1 aldose epimerase family protein [Hungatella hathewayi]
MSIEIKEFGKMPDGKEIHRIVMESGNGLSVEVLNLGGVLRSVVMPDRKGDLKDIVLGFDSLEEYLVNQPNFGAVIGRLAGPVPERRLEYAGKVVMLPPSNALGRHVHGGRKGFARSVWDFTVCETKEGSQITLVYDSPDGDDGYPGNLRATVVYTLTKSGCLKIRYAATADEDTPFNPTNHTYFNLAGHESGRVDNQVLWIRNEKAVVDGSPVLVKGTGLDFGRPRTIGEILAGGGDWLAGGINHFHILEGSGLRKVMWMRDMDSGRVLEIDTDCPGAIVYDGGNLSDVHGKQGAVYGARSGFAFEPFYVKDATSFNPSHARLVGPNAPFSAVTVYRFSNE